MEARERPPDLRCLHLPLAVGNHSHGDVGAQPLPGGGSAPDDSGYVTYTAEPLYGLRFQNAPLDGVRPAGAAIWKFLPGDTSSTPRPGAVGWYMYHCEYRLTCRFRPPGPGRMQVEAYVEMQAAYARSKPEGDQCSSDVQISPALRLDRIAECGQQPGIELTCTPTTVVRGEGVLCEARAHPAGDALTVTEWSFNGQRRTDGDMASSTWAGPMVDSGTVRVQGIVQGQSLQDSAHIRVLPRVWRELGITRVDHRIEVDPATMQPYPPDGRAFGRHERGQLAFDSMEIRMATTGPNAGYFYLTAPVRILPSKIWVHPALYLLNSLPAGVGPSSPGYSDWLAFYNDQNGFGSGDCSKPAVARFRRNVERHEGVTLADNSHVGVANRSFRSDSIQKRFERVACRTPET